MKRFTLILLGIIAMTGLFAQHQPCGMHQGKGKNRKQRKMNHRGQKKNHDMHFMMLAELDLTEKQKTAIESFHKDHRLAMIDLDADLDKLRIEKKDAMKNQNFSAAKKYVDKIASKNSEKQKMRIDLQEKVFKTLTKEQQEKAKQLRNEHPRKMMHPKSGMHKEKPGKC